MPVLRTLNSNNTGVFFSIFTQTNELNTVQYSVLAVPFKPVLTQNKILP